MIAPVIAIAETLRTDHLDVRTKILTRITIGINARISVGQPKKLFKNEVIGETDLNFLFFYSVNLIIPPPAAHFLPPEFF